MVYSNYRIAFDGASWWTSGDGFDSNVVIFCVNNSSPFHAENRKNIFFVHGQGDTFGDTFGSFEPEKTFDITFSKANTNIYLGFHDNF